MKGWRKTFASSSLLRSSSSFNNIAARPHNNNIHKSFHVKGPSSVALDCQRVAWSISFGLKTYLQEYYIIYTAHEGKKNRKTKRNEYSFLHQQIILYKYGGLTNVTSDPPHFPKFISDNNYKILGNSTVLPGFTHRTLTFEWTTFTTSH